MPRGICCWILLLYGRDKSRPPETKRNDPLGQGSRDEGRDETVNDFAELAKFAVEWLVGVRTGSK